LVEEEYLDDQGQVVSRVRDESGHVLEQVRDDEGNIVDVRTISGE
jgi:YD repeat-containing protein